MGFIKHVSLDLWLTLIRTHPEYKKKRAELFCHFFSLPDFIAAEKMLRRVDLMANHINETTGGNLDAFELYLLVLHLLDADVSRLSREDLDQFYLQTIQLFADYPPLPVDDSVVTALQMLQDTGLSMNVLSNTGFIKGYVLQQFFENAGWDKYFAFSIFSDETGHSKPDMAIFSDLWQRLAEAGGHQPTLLKSQVFHFGDNAWADVKGAAIFGFRSARFYPGKGSFLNQITSALDAKAILTS